MEETYQLSTHSGVPPDLVQKISRLASAFIENIGSDGLVGSENASSWRCHNACIFKQIRLSANNSKDLDSAKRLATRASEVSGIHMFGLSLLMTRA